MISPGRFRAVRVSIVLAFVFVGSWFFRFNDPGGSFAGLTDDHFFYVVRGWQILFGDLPVRHFVDHGAPLYYYIAAGVQEAFGRGTLSELAFSVTMLSVGATLTCGIAIRASGSIVLGVLAALFHILFAPRLYNYPKIVVYAVGIPLLWWFADRPRATTRSWLAAWTVVAFLFRHDHGVFMAASTAALLTSMTDMPWRERVRHGVAYAATAFALVAPYLVFIQVNGGLARYVQDASSWAAKDRSRAPVVWPGLFDQAGGIYENLVAWMYYLEIVLPFVALALLALSRDGFRPGWTRAVPKLTAVAVLGIVLNAGFLRSPLAARLADPSVPHAVLVAWLGTALLSLVRSSAGLKESVQSYAGPIRIAFGAVIVALAFVIATASTSDLRVRLDKAALMEGPGKVLERAESVVRGLSNEWRLVYWANQPTRPELIDLALYVNACTRPQDRVFVQPYIPQVLGLARRAFAGGHADLRPGFFTGVEAQLLTLERLRAQSVPLLLLETDDAYRNFRKAFPLITEHFDRAYVLAATHRFDGRFGVQIFVRRDAVPTRRYQPLDWPCYQ